MRAAGLIKSSYPPFLKDEKLAELIGVVLGDGHIEVFPRCERLAVAANSKNKGFITRYANIIKHIFGKEPRCAKAKSSNCVRISIYEKNISERLKIPTGDRGGLRIEIPAWIWHNENLLISYLRGLYEAEGSFCVHKPTSTYKLFFANKNPSLLNNVYTALVRLGFHPNKSGYKVQLSRKDEVYACKTLIRFRVYE